MKRYLVGASTRYGNPAAIEYEMKLLATAWGPCEILLLKHGQPTATIDTWARDVGHTVTPLRRGIDTFDKIAGRGDAVLIFWDGRKSSGTSNVIRQARSSPLPTRVIDQAGLEVSS